jgi:hypothetical protein
VGFGKRRVVAIFIEASEEEKEVDEILAGLMGLEAFFWGGLKEEVEEEEKEDVEEEEKEDVKEEKEDEKGKSRSISVLIGLYEK